MSLRLKNILVLFLVFSSAGRAIGALAGSDLLDEDHILFAYNLQQPDTPDVDLPFPIQDNLNPGEQAGGINLQDPSNIESIVEFDPATGNYYIYQRIGGQIDYRNPTVMSFEEYMNYDMQQSLEDYWREKETMQSMAQEGEEEGGGGFAPRLRVESEAFDRIFGGNTIDIRPQGTAELIFGLNINKNENPQIPERQRRITTFDFDQNIQMNIVGNIGDKMKLTTNYNTQATFDFENQMKLEYTGYEDEIIKKIEAGNVSMPLGGSLISGSQSLFGLKAELQFGKLYSTTLFSQQRGERKEINVEGGAQQQEFLISADNYEANRHFFLSKFFRDRYNQALRSLPVVNSDVQITRIEVWVVNYRANVEDTRNVLAFSDLGENFDGMTEQGQNNWSVFPGNIPSNDRNGLYNQIDIDQVRNFNTSPVALGALGMQEAMHFERIANARRLTESEYTYNEKLGFISLNQALNNDERLAVSYEFFLDGQRYQVGDLSTDGITGTNSIFAKLLKASLTNVTIPLWDLMMKNVYSLGAFQVNPKDFILNIWYNDPTEGIDIPFIPHNGVEDIPLVQLLGLDRLDQNGAAQPDGRFDFVDLAATRGGTIQASNGRIYFTTTEPFGGYLDQVLADNGVSETIRQQVVFSALYDSTKTAATLVPSLNRFKIQGSYQSSSSDEISLNALNIPEGSVTVTAGGVQLQENVDYTVDYNMGRVRILNSGLLESQTPIKISLESNSLFSIQTKTLLGQRLEYRFNDNFNIGGTIMHMYERPLTQKVNIGDEPVRNTIWGLDGNYSTESNMLTKLIDAIPLINTKEVSTINVSGEFAHLIPGHSRAIGNAGNAYIDDFEGSQSRIDLRNFVNWTIASPPQYNDKFPESMYVDSLVTNYNRAHMAWRIIDPLFYRNDPSTPDNINPSKHYQRQVLEAEVFPNRQLPAGTPTNIPTFDMAFYPSERGQYNFDVPGGSAYSSGLDVNGNLVDPVSRWGGIMRSLTTTDFEQANVEFIQFWVMDPLNDDSQNDLGTTGGGKLYVHLGNVSEDILRDGLMAFENGLPPDGTDDGAGLITTYTNWGRVPLTQSIVNAFDNTSNSNAAQDVGLDGLPDSRDGFPDERSHFSNYLNQLGSLTPEARSRIEQDPANDNYNYFRDAEYDGLQLDILERYKRFNGLEGNSISASDPNAPNYPSQSTTLPSTEDVNQDLTLDGSESYFEYEVQFEDQSHPSMQVGQNFITDRVIGQTTDGRQVVWYQFKIPVTEFSSRVNIQDFRSIRFIRMVMREWENPAVLRFARMELLRGEWRRYTQTITEGGEGFGTEEPETSFDIGAVNIEENGDRIPVNYVLPPGIQQQVDVGSANLRNLNEQSLSLSVCGLADGEARAGFRNTQVDMRMYKRLQMFIHAESADIDNMLEYGDISVFIRLGSDFDQNYYEYEVPVDPTDFVPGGSPQTSPSEIWKEHNNMDIKLELLHNLKLDRDHAVNTGSHLGNNRPYYGTDGDRRMAVVGNPVLSNVRVIMIGVRNPKKDGTRSNPWKTDLGDEKCAIVWVNELRMTDFDNAGGWAALGRVSAKLADFGNVAVAANYSTPGFGGLESRVQERQQETTRGFDISTNLELGKFLPDESNIKIPLYLGYSEQVSDPRFDPLSPDIEQSDIASTLDRDAARDRRKRVQDYVQRRSINFTNVRKERSSDSDRKPQVYDVENLSLTYSYNEIFMRSANVQHNTTRNHRGSLSYAFSNQPTNWKPFAASKFFRSSPFLALVKDFNINLGPKQLGFRTDIDRSYNEMLLRNNTQIENFPQPELYTKTFNWLRSYDFQYDITSKLRFTYTANNRSIIGETPGRVNSDYEDEYKLWRDSVWSSVQNFGQTMDFNQSVNLSYKLPLDKLPITDWMSSDLRYTGTYNWQRAPLAQDTLGHNIQNSMNLSINHQFNFLALYNKIGYFKKVNQKFRSQGGNRNAPPRPGSRPQQQQERADGEKDPNRIRPWDYGAKLLMIVKNVNVRYAQTEGTYLPGYSHETQLFGMDRHWNAPGAGFVLGLQDPSFIENAGRQGWLVQNPYVQQPTTTNYNEDFSMRVNLEPLPNMRIELNMSRVETESVSQKYRFNRDLQDYLSDSYQRTGTFSMTYLPIRTAFVRDGDNFQNDVFDQFLVNRWEVANELAANSPFSDPVTDRAEFPDGYGATQQDVVIPAFLSAYRGVGVEDVPLNVLEYSILDAIKNPNWTFSYDGLSKIQALRKFFRTVTLNHAYRANMSVGGFTSNPAYETTPNGAPIRDKSPDKNFVHETQINMVAITEQFAPLVGFDVTLNNSLSAKIEWRKDRNVALSTANYQVTEVKGEEYVVGLGYTFQKMKFPIEIGGRRPESDLTLRADLSIRDNLMITRKMVELTNQITSGQKVISIKVAADYMLTRALTVRAFYDQQLNRPRTTITFPTSNINAGLSLRFTLSQ